MERFSLKDDYLLTSELEALQGLFERRVSWTFGWHSGNDSAPFAHWGHDFLSTDPSDPRNVESVLLDDPDLAPLRDLWATIKDDFLPSHSLVRCYANARTFGAEGYPHMDARTVGNYTSVFYLNPVWKPEWAGETVFLTEAGDVSHAVMPKPGRAVVFDGRTSHVARGVSRICPALRVTLVFKSVAPGSEDGAV